MALDFDELAERLAKHGIHMASEQPTTEQKETQQMEAQKRETEEFWKRKAAELTPTTLQKARGAWHDAQHYYDVAEEKDGNAYWRSRGDEAKRDVERLAQLASAEALTRIADVLETMLEAQHG